MAAQRNREEAVNTQLAILISKLGVTAEPEVTFRPAHEVFCPAARTFTATRCGDDKMNPGAPSSRQ